MACTLIGFGTAKPYCFSSFNVCWKSQTCHWYHKRKNSAINNNETILDPRRHVFLDSRFMYVLKSPLLYIWIRNNAHEWEIEISNQNKIMERPINLWRDNHMVIDIFIYYTFLYITKRIPLCKNKGMCCNIIEIYTTGCVIVWLFTTIWKSCHM